jgi:conjugative relaxase-like TrwC/TraI family protein
MLTISKPLTAAQVRTYHAEEFTNARANYYTAADEIRGQWHGHLAAQWGLAGAVEEEQFQRLADGHHPLSGATLVQHQTARTYLNEHGETVTTVAHRAAWDATFSAPKSVSLTALVGGDDRVRDAHRASVTAALEEAERYVQARIGRNHPAETTGRWIAAAFEHDSARPVDGYAAPQLHTHVVVFNVTERDSGETRALQPRELYKSQQYLTAVYRSELATRLSALGYEIERGSSGQPEIRGYTQDYLEASSPRRQQIEAHLVDTHRSGAGAAQIAAHRTREPKGRHAHDEMHRRHRELAQAYGDQPTAVVRAAQIRAHAVEPDASRVTEQEAVTFAKARNFEREAVVDERALLRDALRRSMGEVTTAAIRTEFEQRVATDEFVRVPASPGMPSRTFTTRDLLTLERETIAAMRAGRTAYPALVSGVTRHDIERTHPHLSEAQCHVVEQILASRDRVVALEGVAGGGKTTTLTAIRTAAERDGYRVEGLAPTSRAAHRLADAGIPAQTVQRHLLQLTDPGDRTPKLYVVDESSLASTRQMHDVLQRLRSDDRVLLVGDTRQHHAVEAGRPYHQLQEAGVQTVRLDTIVRQQDPALKEAVESLARGDIRTAVEQLREQGRVHEFTTRADRLGAIAHAFVQEPDATLVVAPDHRSRRDLNDRIHALLQQAGRVSPDEHRMRVLEPRQEVTGADRQWAEQYAHGNVVRYTTGSRTLRIRAGEYARIAHIDAAKNRVTVVRGNGDSLTYDPGRLQGVTIYRPSERALATGDRVQFTAPFRERQVANRELGTLEHLDASGRARVRLESGRRVTFSLETYTHLDYGYAVTSHSSQGQTADRVLIDVDTATLGPQLVNRRLAYVAVSRGRHDAQIYTNDASQLSEALSRDIAHRSAIERERSLAFSGENQNIERSGRYRLEVRANRHANGELSHQ